MEAKMSGSESNPILNFLIGLFIGVAGTFLYVRFGIELPSMGGVGQRLTSQAIVKTAEYELYNSNNSAIVRRRALAVFAPRAAVAAPSPILLIKLRRPKNPDFCCII